MTAFEIAAGALLIAGPVTAAPGVQNQAWVYVAEDGGRLWGRFLPGLEPYAPGCGPGVGSRERGLKTVKGEPIDGLDLVGWREGEAWRVVVYAMLAGDPDPAANRDCADSRRRHEIASVLVRPGGDAVLEKMKAVGARPWRVAVVLR